MCAQVCESVCECVLRCVSESVCVDAGTSGGQRLRSQEAGVTGSHELSCLP